MFHGWFFLIWIHVTEYFENPFQNRDFEKKASFLKYGGEKTHLEWPKLLFETIFRTYLGVYLVYKVVLDFCLGH